MKMVAAAKFKRNVTQLDHIKEFGTGIDSIMAHCQNNCIKMINYRAY